MLMFFNASGLCDFPRLPRVKVINANWTFLLIVRVVGLIFKKTGLIILN